VEAAACVCVCVCVRLVCVWSILQSVGRL
jgi:hypothetical protein